MEFIIWAAPYAAPVVSSGMPGIPASSVTNLSLPIYHALTMKDANGLYLWLTSCWNYCISVFKGIKQRAHTQTARQWHSCKECIPTWHEHAWKRGKGPCQSCHGYAVIVQLLRADTPAMQATISQSHSAGDTAAQMAL